MYYHDDKDEFFFRWQIKNFSFATCKTGEALESPDFTAEMLDETGWNFKVYPKGKEDGEWIDVFLTRAKADYGGVQMPIIFTVELEAADSTRHERRVSPRSVFERNTTFGFHQYIRRKTLLEEMKSTFLPKDTLTIILTMERATCETEYIREYIAETFAETVRSEVNWTIEKWNEIGSFDEVCKHVQFTADHEASFRMSILESDDKEDLILQLRKLEAKQKKIYVSCRVAVLDAEGAEDLVWTTHHRFRDASEVSSNQLCNRADIKDTHLQNGALSLRCILNMDTGEKVHKMSEKVREQKIEENEDLDEFITKELISDYEKLFKSGDFSDVKLRTGSKVVNCHKSILYARSQVLSGLLDKFEESSKGDDECVIDLDDLDGETLEQMAYFMYSDKVENLKLASALKLLRAGHLYQIGYLKQKCSLYLCQIFNFENVYDILKAGHMYDDGDLKRRAISYISEYFSRICLTPEWENFRKTEKELAAYVCLEIRRTKHHSTFCDSALDVNETDSQAEQDVVLQKGNV